MEPKRYEVGGRVYWQRELVLSQEEELAEVLEPLSEAGHETLTIREALDLLLKRKLLRRAAAVVLVEDGADLCDRVLADAERHLAAHLTLSQQGEVIRDFLEINAGAAKSFAGLESLAGLKVPVPAR